MAKDLFSTYGVRETHASALPWLYEHDGWRSGIRRGRAMGRPAHVPPTRICQSG